MKTILKIIPLLVLSVLCSCSKSIKTESEELKVTFCADSAYQYVHDQVAFGARVPGSTAHYQCVQYLVEQLRRFGCTIEIEQGQLPRYDGQLQQIVNIIAHVGKGKGNRVLLCAHYDSRPWADQEEEYTDRMTPVPGANDGASGVGVILEVVRQISLMTEEQQNKYAIDIIFFDCEDMGTPEFYTGKEREDTWCLGSQLWAHNYSQTATQPSSVTYSFGILLDMVGAPDAIFPREYFSEQYASNHVEKIWRTARSLGYGSLFSNQRAYPVTDDHYYINTIAQIPCVDILHYDPYNGTGFAHWWHTQHDDMSNISRSTLEAVGRTVLVATQK